MSIKSIKSIKRVPLRAGLGLSAVAIVAGTLGGVGLSGVGPATARADVSQQFGTANLMQGQDIGSVKDNVGELNFQETDLYGARTVSACTGSQTFDTVTGDKTLTSVGSRWTNADGQSDDVVTEAIAQAKTASEAKTAAQAVLNALKKCQTASSGRPHYGQVYHGPLRDGDHVWLDRLNAKGQAVGGVAVLLQGNRFGVVEISHAVGNGDDAIKNTLLVAEDRLAG